MKKKTVNEMEQAYEDAYNDWQAQKMQLLENLIDLYSSLTSEEPSICPHCASEIVHEAIDFINESRF